jgi:hypothetical protein
VQLKNLSLANNEISAIENVQPLSTLEKLNLSRNRLASLEGLAVLHALVEVDVSFNCLQCVEAKHLPPLLQTLNVGSNCIQQLSHIASLAHTSSLTSIRIAGDAPPLPPRSACVLPCCPRPSPRQPLLRHTRLRCCRGCAAAAGSSSG